MDWNERLNQERMNELESKGNALINLYLRMADSFWAIAEGKDHNEDLKKLNQEIRSVVKQMGYQM